MPRRRKGKNINGILLLDKPFGLSSNQALQRARYLLDAKKAGHTGSLDPYATGLLPLCFGEATKVSQFMLGQDKTYEVEICFGVATDSGDAEGTVVAKQTTDHLNLEQIKSIVPQFTGRISQVPPMFSALKKNGQPLYKLARQGIEVEREARQVSAYSIDIVDWQCPRLTLKVACSTGFYIRSLAIDLGLALDNVAHVTALRRTIVGLFDLQQAVTLEQFNAMSDNERNAILVSPDKALSYPVITLNEKQTQAWFYGQTIPFDEIIWPNASPLYRIYHHERFLGLGEQNSDSSLKPRRIFNIDA